MPGEHTFGDPAGRELLAAIKILRRMTSGDPNYHSGRKKKEFTSPFLELLDALQRAARRRTPWLAAVVTTRHNPAGSGEQHRCLNQFCPLRLRVDSSISHWLPAVSQRK